MVHKAAVLLFLVVYGLYYLSLFPSVPGGDSGELLAEACQLGVAHPPGYPVFTVLAHWAMKLSFPPRYHLAWTDLSSLPSLVYDATPTKAWYVNHLSAVLSAFAAVCIYLSVMEVVSVCPQKSSAGTSTSVRRSPVPAIAMIAALLYACSPLIWEYAITAEVFGLNNCLCSLVLYQSILTIKSLLQLKDGNTSQEALRKIRRYVMLGGFCIGLALSNQHTSLLHVVFCVLSILYHAVRRLSVSVVLSTVLVPAGALCLLALSSYSYLYFASLRHPESSWGDTTTIEGWLRHVLRSEYGTFRLGSIVGQENAVERIYLYLKHTSQECFHVILPVVALGMWKYGIDYFQGMKKGKKGHSQQSTVAAAIANKKHKKPSAEATTAATDADKQLIDDTASLQAKDAFFQLLFFLWSNWLFYTIIWHTVFSNLPLNAPMPYGVHARFWMQPNITFFTIFGVALHGIYDWIAAQVEISTWLCNAVFVLTYALIVKQRFALMDKSSSGWVLHRYAQSALQTIPSQSLLLAHTDLDLNPMRYLRLCEGSRKEDIDHLSLQMLPYPWFAPKQVNNYPNFTFPSLNFPGISSDRASEGNAEMIRRILQSNGHGPKNANDALAAIFENDATPTGKKYPGGVYLDMQSVNEMEIQPMGIWRGYVLLPWGSQYRVLPQPSKDPVVLMQIMEKLHSVVWKQFSTFKEGIPFQVDAKFLEYYPHGTWEAAAMNVFYDSQYQLALFYLTYAIEKQQIKQSNGETLPLLLDRLLVAKGLLSSTYKVVKEHQTFSSSLADLAKNTALSYLRLFTIAKVCQQYQQRVFDAMKSSQIEILDVAVIETLLTSTDAFKALLQETSTAVADFIQSYPTDVHIQVFKQSLQEVQKALIAIEST